MALRTLFLSKLIGLYWTIYALAAMIHKQATVDAVTAVLNSSALWFLIGIVCLMAGLAMVLGHNLWSGRPLTVVVTLIGWLTLFKGLILVFLPMHSVADVYLRVLQYQRLSDMYAAILLLLGLWLAFAGFHSKSA